MLLNNNDYELLNNLVYYCILYADFYIVAIVLWNLLTYFSKAADDRTLIIIEKHE